MKVLLLQDVAKIGKRHHIVDVPHGYAMNMLIPRKLAVLATPEAQKRIVAEGAAKDKEVSRTRAEIAAWGITLSSQPLVIKAHVNAQGHLFESLKQTKIAEALRERTMACDPSLIHIPAPIKTVGTHSVAFVFQQEHVPFTINVIAS